MAKTPVGAIGPTGPTGPAADTAVLQAQISALEARVATLEGGEVAPLPITTTFSRLKIGAGGFITGLSMSADGITKLLRTDTFGGYRLNASNIWQQLINSSGFPLAYGTGGGVYEVCVAPSDSTICYMNFRGNMFKSTDSGVNWSHLPGFVTVVVDANSPDASRISGPKMAIDPTDPSKVYMGTSSDGVFVTSDGGTTWNPVSGITAATAPYGYAIAFDTTSTIYIASYDIGVYVSTNSGSSWTLTTSGPTTFRHMVVGSDHRVWVTENVATTNNTWRYTAGTWAQLNPAMQAHDVAVDPSDPTHVVIQHEQGALAWTRTGSAETPTWELQTTPLTKIATDVPWLATQIPLANMDAGNFQFDPVVSQKLWFGDGLGCWRGTAPPAAATTMQWTSNSAAIEQLNSLEIIHPPSGYPIYACNDRDMFTLTDMSVYPSSHILSGGINHGWSVDYASTDPSTIIAAIGFTPSANHSCSHDKGITWYRWPTVPGADSRYAGTVAASTPTNWVWVPVNGTNPNIGPYYTLDGGTTWAAGTGFNITAPAPDYGWPFSYYLKTRVVTADRVTANKFYLYNHSPIDQGGGVYSSTDGGATWTRVSAVSPAGLPVIGGTGVNCKIKSVPGKAGHLFWTSGSDGQAVEFIRSTNSGADWSTVSGISGLIDFGFGAIAPGQTYPSIYAIKDTAGGYTLYRSDDECATWVNLGQHPINWFDVIHTIDGNKDVHGTFYGGFGGSGGFIGTLSHTL